MIESTKEKEDAVETLKSELEVKKRKIEEDKSAQESRSDPESVTSSLTSDTNGTQRHSRSNASSSNKKQKLTQPNKQVNTTSSHMLGVSTTEDESSGSSSGGGEDRSSRGRSAQGYSVDKTDATGVSDMTDSNNNTSSSNTSGSGSASGSGKTESLNGEQCEPSAKSISSDAAVASEVSSHGHQEGEHQHNHKDVVVNHGKRSRHHRPPEEPTPMDKNLGLDYEEIFSMSNIPQLIATTSGKIVTWNQSFLKVMGLRRSEVERMTIFSLVKPEMLSNFFEIVSHALKEETPSKSDTDSNDDAETGGAATEDKAGEEMLECEEGASTVTSGRTNYAAMTLPCVDFPATKRRWGSDAPNRRDNLHLTVSVRFLDVGNNTNVELLTSI
jgi:PAS domain-containing protein